VATTRHSNAAGNVGPTASLGAQTIATLRAMRPHQWSKNALLFVPLLLAHELSDLDRWRATFIAFAAFCACASGSYLINDFFDLEADRTHPQKRNRPLASGAISTRAAVIVGVLLVFCGILAAAFGVNPMVAGMLAGYTLVTALYSMVLKQKMVLDVLILAGLFTLRVLTGGQAASVPVSPWLLAFSMFFFVSLASVKRYSELLEWRDLETERVSRRSYQREDAELVQTTGIASGYLSILVIGLYISSDDVVALYSNAFVLWLICPLMLYWLTRVWFLARRGELSEDPVLFATRDLTSYGIGLLVLGVGLWATLGHAAATG
jgi:4-hydroxybenzoate polyprenyltransferase